MFCLGPAEAGTTLATPTVTVVAAPPPTAATMGEVAHEVTTTTSKLISFIFKIVQYSQVQNLAYIQCDCALLRSDCASISSVCSENQKNF